MLKLYKKGYAKESLRGIDEPRPWNIQDVLVEKSLPNFTVLDIGAGTCQKLITLSEKVKHIYALEPSEQMRDTATALLTEKQISNITIVDGTMDKLPFADGTFDMVTCMLAPWDISEIYRVLKSNALVVIEAIGNSDKVNFKEEFDGDQKGVRGFLIDPLMESVKAKVSRLMAEEFADVSIVEGFWKTYYTKEGLVTLMKYTSTVRDFDEVKDGPVIDRITEKYMTSKGIETTQNRILICAKKI